MPTPGVKQLLRTMIDDFSRFTVVCLLKKKSEAPERVLENLFNRKPRIIRSNGGGEYAINELRDFIAKEGTLCVAWAPYGRWYGWQPVLGHLKVYGCSGYVHIPNVKRGSLIAKRGSCDSSSARVFTRGTNSLTRRRTKSVLAVTQSF